MTAAPDLLDPKNDFVFKRLLMAAPALLIDLINAHPSPGTADGRGRHSQPAH